MNENEERVACFNDSLGLKYEIKYSKQEDLFDLVDNEMYLSTAYIRVRHDAREYVQNFTFQVAHRSFEASVRAAEKEIDSLIGSGSAFIEDKEFIGVDGILTVKIRLIEELNLSSIA